MDGVLGTGAKLPALLVIIGQLGVGTSIGCRFSGTRPATIVRTLGIAAVSVLAMLSMTLVFALGLSYVTGLPYEELCERMLQSAMARRKGWGWVAAAL